MPDGRIVPDVRLTRSTVGGYDPGVWRSYPEHNRFVTMLPALVVMESIILLSVGASAFSRYGAGDILGGFLVMNAIFVVVPLPIVAVLLFRKGFGSYFQVPKEFGTPTDVDRMIETVVLASGLKVLRAPRSRLGWGLQLDGGLLIGVLRQTSPSLPGIIVVRASGVDSAPAYRRLKGRVMVAFASTAASSGERTTAHPNSPLLLAREVR